VESYARLAAFRQSLRGLLHFSESAAEKAGVTGQHYHALLVLRNAAHPMTINDLARELVIKHNSAVGLVDRLAEQGLLVRRRSRKDARKVLPQLTAKGLRVIDRLARSHLEELARVGSHLAGLLRQFSGDQLGLDAADRSRREPSSPMETSARTSPSRPPSARSGKGSLPALADDGKPVRKQRRNARH
jgi:DNA-binding MarR family transcriptional regulator